MTHSRSAVEAAIGLTGQADKSTRELSAAPSQMSSHMQTASVACSEVDTNLKEILSSMEVSNQYTQEVQELSKELIANG